MVGNPIDGFALSTSDFSFVGEGLLHRMRPSRRRTARCGRPTLTVE